jgi:hypothetical protein
MFRKLATWFEEQTPGTVGAEAVFRLHPLQLTRFMEEWWVMRTDPGGRPALAIPLALYPIEASSGIEQQLPAVHDDIYPTTLEGGGGTRYPFRHLIYAYLIENTRVLEIFRRVLEECATGERLDVPSADGQAWLRATEALFFSDPHPGQVTAVTSGIRPDAGSVRRNAHYRLFGMDLNHGRPDGSPYPYVRPDAANREFVTLFEEFLREVWRGVENTTNTSGPKPTDDAQIAELGANLADMLLVRRRNGALAREEFAATAAMSWFHLTLMTDTPIIVDLKAEGTSPEERLRKLGTRVGYPSNDKSEQYFAMADAASNILTAIEARHFVNAIDVPSLYSDTPPGNLIRADMMTIIAQWSIASGRDMKAATTASTARSPVLPPASTVAAVGHTNHRELTARV